MSGAYITPRLLCFQIIVDTLGKTNLTIHYNEG